MKYRVNQFSNKEQYQNYKRDPLRTSVKSVFTRTFDTTTELIEYCEQKTNHRGGYFEAIPLGDPLLVEINTQTIKQAQVYREDQIT